MDAIYTTGLVRVLVLKLYDDLFDRDIVLGCTI